VFAELGAFLAIATVVIVTPGQDTALTIRNSLAGGRAGGIATALGVAGGQAVWTVASSAGLATVLVTSERAFLVLRLAGAAYLAYLGAQALLAAVRRGAHGATVRRGRTTAHLSPVVAWRRGLASNLGNPKMAVFFTSLLPQFAPSRASFLALLALGLVFSTMTFVWLTAYALTVAKAGEFLRRPLVRRILDALTGAVLVVLGLRLVTERR
jgi:threonine/homoserine/homoserine lactone efflux protein